MVQPFVTYDRAAWAATYAEDRLGTVTPVTRTGDVDEVYRPLVALALAHRDGRDRLLPEGPGVPFVIGVTGGVAVGKTTLAALLAELLTDAGVGPVAVVTTDGFLRPNATLAAAGLLGRKGFPETYDVAGLVDFLCRLRDGETPLAVPSYSHQNFDVDPGHPIVVDAPAVVILEGVNVASPIVADAPSPAIPVSDLMDFIIYVDAEESDIRAWFVSRFQDLRAEGAKDPSSFYAQWADMGDAELEELAMGVWDQVNGLNLAEHIEPSRIRSDVVVVKGPDHAVTRVLLRRW